MKKLLIIFVACFALMNAGQAMASITIIDFETLGNYEVVDDQFTGLGADFNGSASVLSAAGLSLNPIFPPHSGDKVIYDDPYLGSGIVRVDAVGPLWTMAGGYVTGNTNVTLTAYASDSSVLGTDSTGGANYIGAGLPPNIFLSVSAPGIAYVEFSDTGNTYVVDDFTFEVIPAPGAILLGGIGIGLVGWLRRRRTL